MHENFLEKKYQDLSGSKPVERAVAKKIREGENGPSTKEDRVEAYLDRLEAIFTEPMGVKKNEGEKGGFELLKHKILEKYTTAYEEIPENYWKAQEEEARKRGEAAVWQEATEESKEEVKRKHAENVLTDQRASLEQWLDYFALPDSKEIPRDLKYWIFRNVLNLKELVKTEVRKTEGATEQKIEFPKRSRGTVSPFPDLNQEALNYVIDALVKKLEGTPLEFGYDIKPDEQEELRRFLAKEDFAKLYAWGNELMSPIPEHLLPVTEGRWVKYPQGTDPGALVQTIRGKGTGWCTAGLHTARTQLEGGDFYVYYSLDDNGDPTMPRLAIRMEGHDKIAEDPRGIAYKQNLDPYMAPILEEKLREFGSVGEAYKKKSSDMKWLTAIEHKTNKNEALTREDLAFLYEIDSPIESFGYERDPRIEEIRSRRNRREDAPLALNCQPEEISWSEGEVSEKTKAYVGQWNPKVYRQIKQYPNVRYLYEEFPEKPIFMKTLETDPEIDSPEKVEKALKAKNIWLSDYAKDILSKTPFSGEKQIYELVQFTVAQLGFSRGATTDEIYKEAEARGLELCPAEVGPHLRLEYEGKDRKLIAMHQISARGGPPGVFRLYSDAAGLLLSSFYARPERRWFPDYQFVFHSRK